jgi:hypothetical protein
MDMYVHMYWHMVIEAAKRFDQDDPNQCALAAEVLYVRGVTLQHAFGDEVVPAYASNGQKIWADLPYFYDDIQTALQSTLTRDQRTNLVAFTARLASFGVLHNALFGLGLLLVRDAFESPRPLLSSTNSNEVSIQDLLPAVNCWIYLTRHRIEAFIQDSFDGFETAISAPGPLAPAGCPPGFNLIRWRFWGQRLQEIKKTNHEDISNSAEAIITWWESIDDHTLGGDNPEGDVKLGPYWASSS